jgi:hypothetical protein
MIEDVDRLLRRVLGPLRGREEVGRGYHYRQVVIDEVRWLGYPPRGQVVLRRQVLRPVLSPVPLREQQAVPSGVRDERGHHVMGFAVLPTVLGELQGRPVARRGTPEVPHRTRPRNGAPRVRPSLVVPAFRLCHPLSTRHVCVSHPHGGRRADGVGHTSRAVHGESTFVSSGMFFKSTPRSAWRCRQGIARGLKALTTSADDGSAFGQYAPVWSQGR